MTPISSSRYFSTLFQKRHDIEPQLLQNVNKKSYALYRLLTLPMTLMDPKPSFQGHGIFVVKYKKKTARLKYEVTIAQEKTIPNVWNGTMFGDLD